MKQQNNILFNIDLEDNPRSTSEIVEGLQFLFGAVSEYDKVEGLHNGRPEQTLVALVYTSLRLSAIIQKVEALCEIMNQEFIAVRIWEDDYKRKVDLLVYSPTYEGKERYDFNPEFFKLLPI